MLRLDAIEYAARELRAMFDHFRGHHNHCRHDDLPDTHPKATCPAQLAALSKHIDDIIAQLPDILTHFGILDVNRVEVSSCTFICTCLHLTNTSTVEPRRNPLVPSKRCKMGGSGMFPC